MSAKLRSRHGAGKPSARGLTGPLLIPCPKCAAIYDARQDVLELCPRCGELGSTACCNTAGKGCLCIQCEEAQS